MLNTPLYVQYRSFGEEFCTLSVMGHRNTSCNSMFARIFPDPHPKIEQMVGLLCYRSDSIRILVAWGDWAGDERQSYVYISPRSLIYLTGV